jgi:hypothetical protein
MFFIVCSMCMHMALLLELIGRGSSSFVISGLFVNRGELNRSSFS